MINRHNRPDDVSLSVPLKYLVAVSKNVSAVPW